MSPTFPNLGQKLTLIFLEDLIPLGPEFRRIFRLQCFGKDLKCFQRVFAGLGRICGPLIFSPRSFASSNQARTSFPGHFTIKLSHTAVSLPIQRHQDSCTPGAHTPLARRAPSRAWKHHQINYFPAIHLHIRKQSPIRLHQTK